MATTKRFIKLSAVTFIAVAVLVLNPVLGLLGDGGFHYGAPELRAAVEGTWQLTLAPPDAPGRTITFTLAQSTEDQQTHATRTLVRPAAACSNRSLVRSAGACVDVTDMPLDLRVIADRGPAKPRRAMVSVNGTRFAAGVLRMTIGDAGVEALLSPDGGVEKSRCTSPTRLVELVTTSARRASW